MRFRLKTPARGREMYRRLGELYEAAGKIPQATEHYEQFMELWARAGSASAGAGGGGEEAARTPASAGGVECTAGF